MSTSRLRAPTFCTSATVPVNHNANLSSCHPPDVKHPAVAAEHHHFPCIQPCLAYVTCANSSSARVGIVFVANQDESRLCIVQSVPLASVHRFNVCARFEHLPQILNLVLHILPYINSSLTMTFPRALHESASAPPTQVCGYGRSHLPAPRSTYTRLLPRR